MRDQEDKSEDRGGKVRASEREEVGSQISKFHSLFGGKSSIPLDSMAIPSFKFILIEKRKQKKSNFLATYLHFNIRLGVTGLARLVQTLIAV